MIQSDHRRRPLAAALFLLLALALTGGCVFGGKPAGKQEKGAASPEDAARTAIESLAANNPDSFLQTVDADFRDLHRDFGVLLGVGVRMAAGIQPGSFSFNNLSFRSVYEEDKNFATVLVSGTVVISGQSAQITDEPLFTLKRGGGWFVTSPAQSHWAAKLKGSPSGANNAERDSDPKLPGQYIPPHPGPDGQAGTRDDRIHVPAGTSIPICNDPSRAGQLNDAYCYESNPPTSGPHSEVAAPFAVLDYAAAKETLVHSMEHGGVVIWYNTQDQNVIRQLAAIATAANARGDLVTMTVYTSMEPDTIALTAWTRLDKFGVRDFSQKRVDDFIKAHSRRFNPEGF